MTQGIKEEDDSGSEEDTSKMGLTNYDDWLGWKANQEEGRGREFTFAG